MGGHTEAAALCFRWLLALVQLQCLGVAGPLLPVSTVRTVLSSGLDTDPTPDTTCPGLGPSRVTHRRVTALMTATPAQPSLGLAKPGFLTYHHQRSSICVLNLASFPAGTFHILLPFHRSVSIRSLLMSLTRNAIAICLGGLLFC